MTEEIGRRVVAYRYLKSEYFEKTNTLMLSFAVLLDSTSLADISDWEIDEAKWYSFDEALKAIAPASLAQRFLLNFIHCYEKESKETFLNRRNNLRFIYIRNVKHHNLKTCKDPDSGIC